MKMKMKDWRLLKTIAAGLLLGMAAWSVSSAPKEVTAGTAVSFSGRAAVVAGAAAGVPLSVSDTGELPSSGGAREASLLSAGVPGILSAEVAHAVTIGQGDVSYAEASVANLGLTAGGNSVSAAFVRSWAMAACCDDGKASISGASDIAGLVINGQAIAVTGQPNQTILLPNGKIVINEQITFLAENSGDITVIALHVVVYGVADVVVSSAHADIVCGGGGGPPPGGCGDFVTGGGWIIGTPSGAKGNFGVAGGIKNGQFWGHLTYIDHANGMKVKHTAVTGYAVDPDDADCRIIDYLVTINDQPGTARVRVCDKGEPGRNDSFAISLSNGYSAGGNLAGGNIQLHKCK